jgi:hypothetical protein
MKTYLKYSLPAIFASLTCLSPNVIANESDDPEEDRVSATFNHRSVVFQNQNERFIYAPISELDLDIRLNSNFSGEITLGLNENDNLLGVGDDETGLQRAALVFKNKGTVKQQFEIGLLGHAREFRTSIAGANIGLDTPLSIDLPFREERVNEFAGARYDIDIPIGNKWSVSLNASAGRSLRENVFLNNFDVLSNLINSGSPTAPFFRAETKEKVNELFDKVSHRAGRYFDSLRRDIQNTNFDINKERVTRRVNDLTASLRNYDEALADRLSDEIDLDSLDEFNSEQIKSRLEQTVNDIENRVNERLDEYQASANNRIDNISDKEFNDAVLTIAEHLRDLEIYFHERASLSDQVAAAAYLEANYGDGISNRELAEYLMILKSERATSSKASTLFGASINRNTLTSCFSAGVNVGTLKSDGFRAVDENYASIFVDGCRHFNDRLSVSYTGELVYFDNYRHVEDLKYGLFSLSSALRWKPKKLPDISLHGRLGLTADGFLGPSVHTEIGASYTVLNNKEGRLDLTGSLGYIEPLGVEIEVDNYFDDLTFHTSPTAALSFGIRAKF